ncbi:cytochrome P450 [Mycena leptocephala]|nr:cytochrome P450 [Mycena leptocephala]
MAILLLLALGVLCIVLLLRKYGAREPGLPPGPPTLPVLGNLHLLPTKYAHYKFTEWARIYGGVYSLKLGSGTAVVLTDAAAVKELMDKRSASTADRPPLHLAEVVTQGLSLVLARYGEKWRILRRAAHATLTPEASARLLPIQKAETVQLIYDILHSPQSFYSHIQRYSSSVILSVLYGKRSPRFETPETVASFKVEHEWVTLLEAGATPPMDFFPILKYVPERFAKWKRDCKNVRKMQRDLYFGLLDDTQERLRRGEGNGSFVEELISRQEELGMDREMTGYLSGILIETGSETTTSYLQSLVLALVAHPEAQKKAHEEIDRMSTILYQDGLLSVAKYKGQLIPKGATIFINAWGIFHDPGKLVPPSFRLPTDPQISDLYDDPETFIPDRYLLSENGTKPGVDGTDLRPNFPFGAGRRICPGIHVAYNTINLNVMSLLWAFNFDKATDAGGNPIELDTMDYYPGLTAKPRSFRCKITPRSPVKAEIIDRECLEAADTFAKYEFGLSLEDQEYVAKSRGDLARKYRA